MGGLDGFVFHILIRPPPVKIVTSVLVAQNRDTASNNEKSTISSLFSDHDEEYCVVVYILDNRNNTNVTNTAASHT